MATIVENNNNKNENTTIPLTKIQEEFFTAIENGDIKTVEKILSSKDSTSSVPANFQNPNNGTSGLMLAAKFGQHEIVSVLIQHGAPWNALDQYGESAGDYALKVNNQKMVNQLVNIGVQAELLFAALDANKVANKRKCQKQRRKFSWSEMLDTKEMHY